MTHFAAGSTDPAAAAFPAAARQAVYDAIALRRDVRNFRPDEVPDPCLARMLEAAHRAGSVGFMQPWDFILIRSTERKAAVYELFRHANARAAAHYADDRATRYAALKLQGILDAPLGICVTCDRRRGGPHVLGRDTMPEMDLYSTCLAVQNLWLAARVEGVGVGWMSIVDPMELGALLELPEGVVPVAYLCVGYPVALPDTPMLEATGWRQRLPLSSLVHEDTWCGAAPAWWSDVDATPLAVVDPSPAHMDRWVTAPFALCRADADGARARRVRTRLDALTKPLGSLGMLEALAERLAVAQGRDGPVAHRKLALVFAGDHGIAEEGVSAYRREVTAQLCYNFAAAGGVANALSRQAGAELRVVDVGVDHDFGGATGVRHAKVARGTRNFLHGPAMTADELSRALAAGAAQVGDGAPDVLALGEVGIGNTTSASALLALLLDLPAEEVVGAGTGVGGAAYDRKLGAVDRGLARHRGSTGDPMSALAAVGGFEMAAMVGAMLAAAQRRVPVVLDGFIVGVAALAAAMLAPAIPDYLVASHRSAERAHSLVLARLGLHPLLDLDLRLGECSGAVLALPLVESACRLLAEVRTFQEAGMDAPLDPRAIR